jgi:methionine--tRNA ligase beta chain
MIEYGDFAKLELRVGRVENAEKVEGSEKLVKMAVAVGGEKRQLVAGIGNAYAPEELVGKKIIVLMNLEPKKLMGLESQGMLLAAWEGDDISLLTVDRELPEGAKVG